MKNASKYVDISEETIVKALKTHSGIVGRPEGNILKWQLITCLEKQIFRFKKKPEFSKTRFAPVIIMRFT